jgi:membrane-bound ClpP family serine protease
MILIIGLIILGIILLVLEILVLPGLVAGIIGGLMIMASIIWMYQDYGSTAGHITAVSSFLATVIAIWWSLKSKAWNRYSLKDQLEGKVNDVASLGVNEGDEGRTLSALRPSGTILFGDKKIEGHTSGEFMDAGTKVIVTKVFPNKVIVKIKVSDLSES